jgi:hypothetical protein
MSWKWIVIGGAGLSVLGAVVLFLVWIASILSLTSGAPTTTPLAGSPPPGAPALSPAGAPTVVDPRLPSQAPHPMTRGISRATRAALTNELGAAIGGLKSRFEQCPDQPFHRGAEESAQQQKMIELVKRQIAGGGEIVPSEIAGGTDKRGARELPTIMMLDVETYDSQVKIVDAALAMHGSASDAFVACAQQILRGQIILVPAAATGQRLQIPVDLGAAGIEGQPLRHSMRRRR